MHQFETIPITEVTKKNFEKLWPVIIKDVSTSSFISIDAEMSGLGCTKKTMNSNLNERYAAISNYATTRSIISLGLACFSCLSNADSSKNEVSNGDCNIIKYNVSVYNIILLCSESYIVDPSALEFLVNHGFDFNKQYSEGIPFYKGNDRPNETVTEINMRNLFCEIIRQRKPLVLHNGLTDLIFMYQCFYADCPQKLTALMADISEIFPNGVYDTKYTAEFVDHTAASFLLYLFRYSLLKNKDLQDKGKISLDILFNEENVNSVFSSLYTTVDSVSSADVCIKYAAYGWCLQGNNCKKSHNIDAIIRMHKNKTSKKRKRKRSSSEQLMVKVSVLTEENVLDSSNKVQRNSMIELLDSSKAVASVDEIKNKCKEICESNTVTTSEKADDVEQSPSKKNIGSTTKSVQEDQNKEANLSKGHRSGVDAFMTGYIFALFFVSKYKPTHDASSENKTDSKQYSDLIPYFSNKLRKSVVNKLYLSGKSIPLSVCKSSYTKTSKNHNDKILKIYLNF